MICSQNTIFKDSNFLHTSKVIKTKSSTTKASEPQLRSKFIFCLVCAFPFHSYPATYVVKKVSHVRLFARAVLSILFLDASSHLYNRLCPLVCRSVGLSVCRSVTHSLKSQNPRLFHQKSSTNKFSHSFFHSFIHNIHSFIHS